MELLDPVEVRVLGALIEKEATTPEYYPLSLNALVNACNQKSNREPVVDYDEATVRDAIGGLRANGMAFVIEGSRVTKYSQRLSETLNLGRRELAALCVLLLRGPQTLGEIKDRSERIYPFSDLEEIERVLQKLADYRDGPLVRRLERQPGQKEARYAQLLAGEPVVSNQETLPKPAGRIAELEEMIIELRRELQELRTRFDKLESDLR